VGDEKTAVSLDTMQWASVCAALQCAIKSTEVPPREKADLLSSLREIDRVMRGADHPAPPDDVMDLA
jgi:hypothetical protein